MQRTCFLSVITLLLGAGLVHASITYTSDATLSDFTSGMTFGTFTSAPGGGDVAIPYTPTAATVNSGDRVIGAGSAGPIVVQFASAESFIRVFPNIDHFGFAYDGYQYTISGSNDGIAYTPLFDALTVAGAGEPFTLATFTGTAPTRVNNVLTPGAGPNGTVGYEADFTFAQAYKFYKFGASTEAINSGNEDQELSAVGTVPEPASWPVTLLIVGVIFAALRLRKKSLTT
jgi:hypothetical protein